MADSCARTCSCTVERDARPANKDHEHHCQRLRGYLYLEHLPRPRQVRSRSVRLLTRTLLYIDIWISIDASKESRARCSPLSELPRLNHRYE
jgi:hypothetical protein